jgi:dihydrodipicolinate synthase/N-acetylneuraminate lyase
MTQSELMRFFELAAEGTGIPLLLYNAPQYTRKVIAPESVAALATHEKIVGLKESSGDMDYLQLVIRRINRELHHGSGSPLSNIIGLKYAMSLRGLCQFHFAEPLAPELPRDRKKITERLLDDFISLEY